MKLAKLFRREPEPADAPELSSRDRLEQAKAVAARCKAELEAATERRMHVREVIDAEGPARDAAESAVKSATEAAKRCALAGTPSGDQAALDAAAEAQRRALQATIRADGARAALSEVMANETNAKMALKTAQDAVLVAAADVLFDAEAPALIAQLVHATAASREAVASLMRHFVLRRPLWGSGHPYHGLSGGQAGESLAQVFAACRVYIATDDDLRNNVDQFVDLRRVDELKRAIQTLAAGK